MNRHHKLLSESTCPVCRGNMVMADGLFKCDHCVFRIREVALLRQLYEQYGTAEIRPRPTQNPVRGPELVPDVQKSDVLPAGPAAHDMVPDDSAPAIDDDPEAELRKFGLA